MRTIIILAACLMAIAGGAMAATPEKIGSWVLSCPSASPVDQAAEACLLRYGTRFFDKGGVTGELDVLARGKSLVPVLALRGVGTELLLAAALAGKAEASVQFTGGQRLALDCATTPNAFICSPRDDAARTLAIGLPSAQSITVRMSFEVPGMKPLPIQERTLDLTGTSTALTRLRTVGPSQVPDPVTTSTPPSPVRLMDLADKALKAAGYSNGVQGLLAKYRGR
jgi:hypothetical protein